MASASLPTSSSARRWDYDVFLSYQGRETGKGFTSELRRRLTNRGIITYMDDPDNQIGDFISPTVEEKIKGSSLAIIILSPHYASSTLCLQELTKICQCMDNRIRPLFYDLKYLKRRFGDAFITYKNSGVYTSEKLQEWENVLEVLYNLELSGWDVQNYKTERALVKQIVKDICKLVKRIKKNQSIGPVQTIEVEREPMKQAFSGSTGGTKSLNVNIKIENNQSQQNGDSIGRDRGGDGGNNNNGGFIAGAGGPANGNNTFN